MRRMSISMGRPRIITAHRWRSIVIVFVTALAFAPLTGSAQQTSERSPVTVHMFWGTGCPHCAKAHAFLERLVETQSYVHLELYELSEGEENRALFRKALDAFGVETPAVPFIVIGERYFIGYGDDETTGSLLKAEIERCRLSACPDIIGSFHQRPGNASGPSPAVVDDPLTQTVRLPFVGDIELGALSLPALTIVMAGIDGFNPCAMWVLIFLIGVLVGMTDHVRMWALGIAFLLTTALVYFVFLAAWLNVFLFLGALVWIRLLIGLLAIGGGGYYLREYFANPEGVCRVAPAGRRQKIMTRLKASIQEKSFLLALGGIIAVAIAVNLVELLCSAGIPAVYTQILALSDLSAWGYYGYLLLYIGVFLLDDLVIFAAAMATLQATGLTAAYSRYSHLIGGGVLLVIGFLLIFFPQWLTFSTG